MGLITNGKKYVFPAEFDLYLDVSPWKSNAGTQSAEGEGNIYFKVYHTLVNPTPDGAGSEWKTVEREEVPPQIYECVDDLRFKD